MCQFTSACPTRHHTYGKCRYSGRRPASGGVGSVVGLGVLVVAVASYLGFTPARLVEVVTSRPTQSASATPRTTGNAAQTPNLRRVGECDVQEVVDGDTLVCSTGQRVRLLGVDAPELARNGRPQQCHAKSARRALTSLVGGRTVTLHADDGQPARDVYGRTLAYAASAGQNVSVQLVQGGNARARTSRPALAVASQLDRAEQAARSHRSGLWGYC